LEFYEEGVFLAPKVYALKALDGESYKLVVKGPTVGSLQWNQLKEMYLSSAKNGPLSIEDEKPRSPNVKTFAVENLSTSFSSEFSYDKREKVYSTENSLWVDTKPFRLCHNLS